MTDPLAHPPITDAACWREARITLLAAEKALTREKDRVNAARRRLPMVPVEKDYRFQSSEGEVGMIDLFQGQIQLVVYHFMFDPEWDEGCPGCTGFVQALGDLTMLAERNTRFVLVSRAPVEKLENYRMKMGWDWPWYSSFGSDFNYDFHVTHDATRHPVEYNYQSEEVIKARRETDEVKGEDHGLSVFFRLEDRVFHTYSVYARGVENLTNSYEILDVTPYGRQEDFEDSPVGWPQRPTYG